MPSLIYEEPKPISRTEAEQVFASNDSYAIESALVNIAFHDDDWHWVQDKCLGFTSHPEPPVRQVAITCLGHVARIHGKLDLAVVLPVLKKLSRDPDVDTEDTLNDIRMFLPNAAP